MQMRTIIIKIDPGCGRCQAKIRKVLDRIREKGEFVIHDVEYDEKKGLVRVSGPFDPDKLADKLCCKACSIIKEIEIVEPIMKEEPKPPPPKKEKVKTPATEQQVDLKPQDKKKEDPHPPPPPPPKVVEVPVPYPCPYPYPFPAYQSGCFCHHGHGGCQCCSCPRQDPPPPCGYMMVCEDEPSGACAVM